MPIETGSNIVDLDAIWPLGGDFVLEGDDHLRLIKFVLKAQFPGVGGQGFSKTITATEDEINYLAGLTGNVQDQIDAIIADDAFVAPSGTSMPFYMATPPVGWTQDASNNDAMLRVVDTAGGGAGGTDSPISLDWSHLHTTDAFALLETHMPSHNHQHGYDSKINEGTQQAGAIKYGAVGRDGNASGIAWCTSNSKGGGTAHEHGDTNSQGGVFTPKYIEIIIAVKD